MTDRSTSRLDRVPASQRRLIAFWGLNVVLLLALLGFALRGGL